MRPGTRVDHDRFCELERWTEVRDERGRKVGHHVTYELHLTDGRILRTRVSRPVRPATYGPSLWRAILRDQLCVTEDEFWACVSDGTRPDRGGSVQAPPPTALPAQLVYQLIHVAGLSDAHVARLSLEEAVEAMTVHWSRPRNHP